jgi:hypothetical protein
MIPRLLSAVVLALALSGSAVAAGGEKPPCEVIPTIVGAWQARQAEVKTLACSTKVTTVYPKGCLSDEINRHKKQVNVTLPPEEKKFSGQPCSWKIDFAARRVRKEYQLTNPFFHEKEVELTVDKGLHLFANGKYSYFRPRDSGPQRKGVQHVDMMLYGGASHSFLLCYSDLPLLWLAGGVNGQWPCPADMQRIDRPLVVKGERQRKGKPCVVITVPEQQSKRSVRELWVGTTKPYPIYYCCARDGDRVYWEIEVQYGGKDGRLLPTEWTATGYHQGKVTQTRAYTVQRLQLNVPLPAATFEKRLEPGMIAYDVEKDQTFRVDRAGNLVPVDGNR